MREKTKVVEINGKSYEIGRFTPQTGSWIANLLITTMLKSQKDSAPETEPSQSVETAENPEQKAASLVSVLWMMASADMPESTYARIQQHALLACGQIHREGIPANGIIKENGKWIATELQDDPVTVSKLVSEALQFNIAPFFVESVSNSAQQK